MHRGLLAAVAVAALLGTVALGGCTRNAESLRSFQLVNQQRHEAGIAPLGLDGALVDKAQAWAEHLAATGALRHSTLTDGAPAGWLSLAENVGVGASPEEVHLLLMASPSHRANLLGTGSDRVGVGAAWSGGRLYVVQVFADY